MTTLSPVNQERRRWPRHPPSYTPDEIRALRILRIHFRETCLFCLLSDGKMLSCALAVSAALAAAPPWSKYQWQVVQEGAAVAWQTPQLQEALSLDRLLAHPSAQVSALPGNQ